ncbi:MFS general substrate transporter [Mycena albidolilacea]|uniref:MFS general substrate transporter n=1 Tax=Mycena albidolilacea TaxID=1033008 RepID=A0AAD6ZN83_9AGAR|nr:MFS general substrate transporter [Mycena albidolilacea]
MPSTASLTSNEKGSVSSDVPSTADVSIDERRLLRKLDWRLLPILTLLYLWSFLDRTNIGNAKIAGLTDDLKMVGLQYNICAAVFFVPYCLFEVPSNMVLKKVRPNLWLAFLMLVWGSIMMSMAAVKRYEHLVVARFFLGVAEAGLLPGATFYLSQWYPRRFYAQRMGLFIGANTLAGAFGGLLAFAIQKMDGIRNLQGWSWIFLLEGLVTVVIAVFGFLFLPDYPEKAKFLTSAERAYLVDLLAKDSAGLSKKFEIKFFWQAVGDYNSYLYALVFLTSVIPGYCFALFVPTIIKGLGYSAANAQLMSTPPYIFACLVTVALSRISDKTKMRGPYILGVAIMGIIGYTIWFSTQSAAAGYIAAFFACAGTLPNIALVLSWVGSNTGGDLKRSVVLAMVIGLGNLGGVCSSFVYRPQDKPTYRPGHGTAIGCLCLSFTTVLFMSWNYRRLNAIKAAQIGESKGEMDAFADMGDASPHYRQVSS